MDATTSSLSPALDSLWSTLLALSDQHPFFTTLLVLYALGVIILSIRLFTSLHDFSTIPWLHSIFLTDGILVCCYPLAAVLPILLWPLMVSPVLLLPFVLVCRMLDSLKRWFCAAPTFCGIRRESCAHCYSVWAEELRGWCESSQRDWGPMQTVLPISSGDLRYAPHTSYGAVNVDRVRGDQNEYWSTRGQYMQYVRQAPCQTDGYSEMSAPPPYEK